MLWHSFGIKSVLCLDGAVSARDISEALKLNVPFVAADGAVHKLMCFGVKPHAVVGDMDSVGVFDFPDTRVVLDPSQDTSDFQKALEYLYNISLLPSLVIGIGGGYLDHVINNVTIFLKTENILLSWPIVGFAMKSGEEKELNLPINTKITIFGVPECIISSKGLKWELNEFRCDFTGRNSFANRTVFDRVLISVESGTALIFTYLESIADCGIK